MHTLFGLSDSPNRIAATADKCPRCAGTTKIGKDACLPCMLQEGISATGDESCDNFEEVLGAIDLPDANWLLGNYHILGEIGRGGMGIIYRAQQRGSRRIVALKRVLGYQCDSDERTERFRREAEAAASLDHPNILPIYEVG